MKPVVDQVFLGEFLDCLGKESGQIRDIFTDYSEGMSQDGLQEKLKQFLADRLKTSEQMLQAVSKL